MIFLYVENIIFESPPLLDLPDGSSLSLFLGDIDVLTRNIELTFAFYSSRVINE